MNQQDKFSFKGVSHYDTVRNMQHSLHLKLIGFSESMTYTLILKFNSKTGLN